jgi:hypothetical protein
MYGWQVFRAEVILAPHVYVRDELIKPILRRLETMTEKEKVEIDDAYEDFKKKDKYSKNAVIKWAALHTSILLSKHFDIFGLIDAGLAIDSTTLPNSIVADAVSDTRDDESSNVAG